MTHAQAFEKLAAYVDSQLPAADHAAVDDHLATCPLCTAEVRSIRLLSVAITSTGLPTVTPLAIHRLHHVVTTMNRRRSERFVARLTSIAACLALASGTYFFTTSATTPIADAPTVPIESLILSAHSPDDSSPSANQEALVSQWMLASLATGKTPND